MISVRRWMVVAILAASLGTVAQSARADGLATSASALPPEVRRPLQAEIAGYLARRPDAFDAVRGALGHRPEMYTRRRNPVPEAARELRALGAEGLLPMLDALAFDAPERGALTESEWTALTVGMLEAVGALRDPRSGPVLRAIFDGAASPRVLSAAARAMGRLGGDAELAVLVEASDGDTRSLAAIQGLGECKRIESAKRLAALLARADEPRAAEIGAALGKVGSSWAWRAMGPRAAATALAVREVAARALVQGFVRHRGARAELEKALGRVAHPATLDLVSRAQSDADVETATALRGLGLRLDRR